MAMPELHYQREHLAQPDGGHEQVQQMLDELVRTLGYKRAFMALVNTETNALEGAFGVNLPPFLLESLSTPLSDADLLVQALLLGKALRVDDALHDSRIPEPTRAFYADSGMLAYAAIPLLPVPGVLIVSKDHPLTEADINELLPYFGRLVVTLWEGLHGTQGQESPSLDAVEREWLWWMVNSVPVPVVLSDEQNNILLENGDAKRLFKANPGDSEGKRHAIELNNFLLSAALSSFSLDQGAALGRDLTLVDPIEGSELLYEVIGQQAVNLRTGQRGLVSVLENVTDLRRAVVELQRSLSALQSTSDEVRQERDRLNLILENVDDPIVVTGSASEIILMNSAAERLLQTPDEYQPDGRATIYLANNAKLTSFLAQLQLEMGPILRGELQLVEPASGEQLSMGVTATKARDELGQVVAIVCVLHDLTQIKELERRRVEQQLFESEKLAAVGRLAASVAHEVNNPLEAIKNALHLLVTSIPEGVPNRRFLDIANKETLRVSVIIRQMLGLYRPGTAKELVDVNSLLEEVIALLRTQFQGRVWWRRNLDYSLPKIMASEDKLKQVFLNLLINAREAMDDAGELGVATRLASAADAGFLPGEWVLVEISDTGRGIAEEHLPHIFDPFFSTKREQQGTGLGLWVSQDIIQQHGGEIKVRSQLGQGSTFTVALPIGGENG